MSRLSINIATALHNPLVFPTLESCLTYDIVLIYHANYIIACQMICVESFVCCHHPNQEKGKRRCNSIEAEGGDQMYAMKRS